MGHYECTSLCSAVARVLIMLGAMRAGNSSEAAEVDPPAGLQRATARRQLHRVQRRCDSQVLGVSGLGRLQGASPGIGTLGCLAWHLALVLHYDISTIADLYAMLALRVATAIASPTLFLLLVVLVLLVPLLSRLSLRPPFTSPVVRLPLLPLPSLLP